MFRVSLWHMKNIRFCSFRLIIEFSKIYQPIIFFLYFADLFGICGAMLLLQMEIVQWKSYFIQFFCVNIVILNSTTYLVERRRHSFAINVTHSTVVGIGSDLFMRNKANLVNGWVIVWGKPVIASLSSIGTCFHLKFVKFCR